MGIFDGIKDAIHNVENAVTGHGAASTHDPLQDAGVPNQADAIAEALTAKSGRPRNLPFRGFLIACCLHVCIQERNFYRGKIADMIAELTRDQRASLGLRGPISYSQIVRASLKLERGPETASRSKTRTTRGTRSHCTSTRSCPTSARRRSQQG